MSRVLDLVITVHATDVEGFSHPVTGVSIPRNTGRHGIWYGLPCCTPDFRHLLPRAVVRQHVQDFFEHARAHAADTFHVTPLGRGVVGYTAATMAGLFASPPDNVELPFEWAQILRMCGDRRIASVYAPVPDATGDVGCDPAIESAAEFASFADRFDEGVGA